MSGGRFVPAHNIFLFDALSKSVDVTADLKTKTSRPGAMARAVPVH